MSAGRHVTQLGHVIPQSTAQIMTRFIRGTFLQSFFLFGTVVLEHILTYDVDNRCKQTWARLLSDIFYYITVISIFKCN